jgi:hypothetical protein
MYTLPESLTQRAIRAAQSALLTMLLALVLVCNPSASMAKTLPTPTCAWPFEWSPFGLGNWAFPDTGNRWWYMPIDPKWRELTITGDFPEARFFSVAVYNNAPVSTGLADHLFDQEITPDKGSVNPFDPSESSKQNSRSYTITVKRTDKEKEGEGSGNVLRLDAKTGWLLYRLYLPNAGEGGIGGVPLPTVHVGQTTLEPCPTVNRQSDLAALQQVFLPAELENPTPTPPVPDRIWFGPLPTPPPNLLPNPDQKYMVSFFMSEYESDRIIVIRGKMPAFPDTNRGKPVSQPAPGFDRIQMRYWSMCVGEFVSPLPITTKCAVDADTPLDGKGFYTIVISNDVLRPGWLRKSVVWLPWGSEQRVPRTMLLRNLLPSPDFTQTVQEAIALGCGVDFKFPIPPDTDEITQAGECAQGVMGDYYPVAVWCDRSVYIRGGWRRCFAKEASTRY